MKKVKTIKLLPFKMDYWQNGYAKGLLMKRKITFQEANHIAQNILGISTELTWDDLTDDKEELKERKDELVSDITKLINGDIGFDYISEEWACGDALDDLNIAIFFDMLLYLNKKSIV